MLFLQSCVFCDQVAVWLCCRNILQLADFYYTPELLCYRVACFNFDVLLPRPDVTPQFSPLPVSATPIFRGASIESLNQIKHPDIDMVILEREVPNAIESALAELSGKLVDNQRFHLGIKDVRDGVLQVFKDWNFNNDAITNWIANDVENLATQFAKTMDVSDLLLRVELVEDNACRKFHIDNVKARLICTYMGPGTEYGLAPRGEIPASIQSIPTGLPALFKGKIFDGAANPQVVHRSPQVNGTGISRLVIVINEDPLQAS